MEIAVIVTGLLVVIVVVGLVAKLLMKGSDSLIIFFHHFYLPCKREWLLLWLCLLCHFIKESVQRPAPLWCEYIHRPSFGFEKTCCDMQKVFMIFFKK